MRVGLMAISAGGRCFRLQMECMKLVTKHIPEGQFQWFIDIVSYLQFVTGETLFMEES